MTSAFYGQNLPFQDASRCTKRGVPGIDGQEIRGFPGSEFFSDQKRVFLNAPFSANIFKEDGIDGGAWETTGGSSRYYNV